MIFGFFIKPVSQSGCSRFVDYSSYLKPRNLTRIFSCLSLRIVKICRNSNNSFGYFVTQVFFSGFFHLLKNHCTNFRRRVNTVINFYPRCFIITFDNLIRYFINFRFYFIYLSAHKSFYRKDCVFLICNCLALCRLPD